MHLPNSSNLLPSYELINYPYSFIFLFFYYYYYFFQYELRGSEGEGRVHTIKVGNLTKDRK
jgi:hypothetical protein